MFVVFLWAAILFYCYLWELAVETVAMATPSRFPTDCVQSFPFLPATFSLRTHQCTLYANCCQFFQSRGNVFSANSFQHSRGRSLSLFNRKYALCYVTLHPDLFMDYVGIHWDS